MGFSVFESTNTRIHASLGLSGSDVVSTLVLAEEAYGVISLEALPARVIRKARGSGGTSDPLDQISTIGWKAAHAAIILNQANMVRIVHNVSSKTAA